MDQAIDSGRSGHGVFEDFLPFREGQVATDHDTGPFIAVGQKRKQHFHFFPALLDIADIIDDDGVIPGQFS
ncbi:hypothetical protein ES708_22792 [subsurface metagenome]